MIIITNSVFKPPPLITTVMKRVYLNRIYTNIHASSKTLSSTTTRHVILNEVKKLVAKGCKTLRFVQGDIDKSRSDAVQDEVSL